MALTDNILRYWKLDNSITDSVASQNLSTTNTFYTTGKIYQGIDYNGTNAFSSLPVTAPENGSYTVALWAKWDSLNAAYCYNNNYNGTTVSAVGLKTASGTIKGIGFTNGAGGGEFSVDSSVTPTIGTWYHIAITFLYDVTATNRVLKIYINGSYIASASPTGGITPGVGNAYYLGRTGSTYFDGIIDEVGIWTRDLSASEISELYNSGFGLQYPFTSSSNFFQLW